MPGAQSEIYILFFRCQIKCNQYWPESTDEEYYGDINISKCEERHFAFYVIRKFPMSNSEVKKSTIKIKILSFTVNLPFSFLNLTNKLIYKANCKMI